MRQMTAAYPPSFAPLEARLKRTPAGEAATLAHELIALAKSFDASRLATAKPHPAYAGVMPDMAAPPFFTHPSIIGKDWADDAAKPLEAGETWNKGRRATQSNITYALDDNGLPQNPYIRTGLRGQGLLGQFGPNHAVDNGIMLLEQGPDGPLLAALGIRRGAVDGFAPALSGGFVKYRTGTDGVRMFDDAAVAASQAEEFFEEMVSGSITLTGEWQDAALARTDAFIARLENVRGTKLDAHEAEHIARETEVAQKLDMVRATDPAFMERLTQVFEHAAISFTGPMLNDPRNTDNAWIETRLSTVLFDDTAWQRIKGGNSPYAYDFVGGDDASETQRHVITPQLIRDAFASHGALFLTLAASYLAAQGNGAPGSILAQSRDLLALKI